MSFVAPWILLALALVVASVAFDAWRPWRCHGALKGAAILVRGLLLCALVLALAGPTVEQPGEAPLHVFVLDRSASIDEERLDLAMERIEALAHSVPSGHRRALVLADGAAVLAVQPDEPWSLERPERSEAAMGTDLAGAVGLSLSIIDPSAGGRVVVVTDGGDTHGGLDRAAREARDLGIALDAVPIPAPPEKPGILSFELERDVVRAGETLDASLVLRGGSIDGARLELLLDGEPILDEDTALPPEGVARRRLAHPLPADVEPGPRTLTARLAIEGRRVQERTIGLTVGPPPVALLVAEREREHSGIAAVLLSQGFEVRHLTPGATTADQLPEVDLVVIGDVPAAISSSGVTPLSESFLSALRRWVSAGGGLITLGGDQTYELGGWGASPIARALPLDLAPEAEDVEPAITVVHVIDNSASMGDWSGQQRKMALANEATVASMRLLRARDQIEVMAVNTEVHRVLPLQPATDPTRMAAMIRSIKPRGGGIYVYTSLIAAEQTLARSETPLKHIILYSDAQDAEEKVKGMEFGWGPGPNSYQVAERLVRKGVTLSVIALGDPRDQDVPFLRQLAEIGGGRFHITREAEELRALYLEETRQIVRSVVKDGAIYVKARDPHPALEGVRIGSAPPFLGYVEVRARATATVPLVAAGQKPILASWQYGLGHVASLSTDLGPRWGRRWLGFDDYHRFVAQLARWALRPPVARGAALEVHPHVRGMKIEVQRLGPDGLALAEGGISARLLGPKSRPLELRPIEPGRWIGIAEVEPGSSHEIAIDSEEGEIARQAVVAPPPLELDRTTGQGATQLAQTSGGRLDPEAVGEPSAAQGQPRPIGWIFALIATLLLPLDAWLRRPARRP
ncbi:MAG: VWA domain-containing protein [Deltaproteobacteria bacterium]|nr:MAG: VWA domain-containing protein [Deltaproteobacteria bacterium]